MNIRHIKWYTWFVLMWLPTKVKRDYGPNGIYTLYYKTWNGHLYIIDERFKKW